MRGSKLLAVIGILAVVLGTQAFAVPKNPPRPPRPPGGTKALPLSVSECLALGGRVQWETVFPYVCPWGEYCKVGHHYACITDFR